MSRSPYVVRLREKLGNDLLLLPCVAVLPWDNEGRLLLVRAADSGRWQPIGGQVEVDETPTEAALREAKEGAGVTVELGDVLGALGGPSFQLTQPNGDQAAYVPIVYEAAVVEGSPAPDDAETTEVAWVGLDDLDGLDLTDFTTALFAALGLSGA